MNLVLITNFVMIRRLLYTSHFWILYELSSLYTHCYCVCAILPQHPAGVKTQPSAAVKTERCRLFSSVQRLFPSVWYSCGKVTKPRQTKHNWEEDSLHWGVERTVLGLIRADFFGVISQRQQQFSLYTIQKCEAQSHRMPHNWWHTLSHNDKLKLFIII